MKSVSLKIQITVLVILLVAGLVGAFSWTVTRIENRMILSEVLQRVVIQARNLALGSSKALLHEDPEFELHPLVARVLDAEQDIISIVIVDRQGMIKGHRDILSIDQPYRQTPGLRPFAGAASLSAKECVWENDDILEVEVPITDQGEHIGAVYVQYSKNGVYEAVASMKRRMLRIGLAALIGGALVSLLLAAHITKPVKALTRGAEAIGAGRLDTRINVHSIREIETLGATFNAMAKKLEENRRAMLEKERIERELEIAHEIQATLLPSHLPSLANLEVDAYYHPASEVGGDYFDLIPLDGGQIMVIVGDVAGKGVPGLVIMAMVRILARALAQNRESPGELLRHLNVLLKKDMRKNLFVTLFCGLLDARDGHFVFASAAHMPLLVFRAERRIVDVIGTKAKPLGLFPDEIFARGVEERRIVVQPGDCVIQFTDGLNEMRNAAGEEFGLPRLIEVVAGHAAIGARHLISELRASLDTFRGGARQSDDLTIVALSAMSAGVEPSPLARAGQTDRVLFE
jgi:serine phosphatase RsbU (regulator of sigma subunit)